MQIYNYQLMKMSFCMYMGIDTDVLIFVKF